VLTPENRHQLWIPEGFAHGFLALADDTEFLYKTSRLHDKASDRSILWNDADIGINWPGVDAPIMSHKDAEAPGFRGAETFE
jgi:dTDP-4-dehydrorhamnose 3,5-epimerase